MTDDEPLELNIEPLGEGMDREKSAIVDKDDRSTQLGDTRVQSRHGIGKKPPYNPDLLASYIEKNETHSVAVRKKARYEVGYGFDLAPVDELTPDDASDDELAILEDFWFSRDSLWQTGPRRRAEPTVPEEVLELARQDFHAIGWAALEILTDNMGRPVGLAHVPANTIRVRTPQSNYERIRHPETGAFTDQELGEYASRGYVQMRHGKRRYFAEAGDRYRGMEVVHTPATEGDSPDVRYIEDNGSDDAPIFVDREAGDVAVGDAGQLDNEPANGLIFVRNPSVLADDYGIPDWVSAIRTITGDEAAKDYNRQFFEHDTIPRFVIKVTGGTLSEESKKDLRKMLKNLREEDHRTVVLEVDKFNDSLDEDVEIELEPLGQGVTEEMSFANYRTKNEHEVAKVHELPPVLIGVTETSNRSNSEAQVHEFATEVIKPEQHKFAERLHRLIHQRALGVTDYTINFRLRGGEQPSVQADVARKKIQAVKGAIPVNRALEMIGEDPLDDERGQMLIADIGTDADPAIDMPENGNGEVEASRPDYLPPKDNKIGEIDFEDVKEQLQVENGRATKDPIEQMDFDSSNLSSGLYDFGTRDLFIEFKRDGQNSLYVYTDVSASKWQGLANASSHGEYHHAEIRLVEPYLEVTNFHSRLPEGPMPDADDIPEGIPSEI